ncbi:MAG: S8 family serine peptidase, partial [Cyclobacteriaceae bacterium]|nr:S8 family serine peptidase [Cyclobacteriaceae bacterium]
MDGFLNKCDIELQVIYANHCSVKEGNKSRLAKVHPVVQGTGRLSVLLRYSNDIQPLKDLGFRVTSIKDDNTVQGSLRLTDLESIASHQNAISLSVGRAGETMLDTSVVGINARGSGQVWQVNSGTGQFSGLTGNGVVVGIIDTGIDWTHPVFLATESPKTTRIKRIWDPGIDPHDSVQSPQAQYMEGSERYGAEYTETMINAVLQGNADTSTIKHKDCGGHGTHVASIAAGDGRAPKPGESNSSHKYIGVAPKADIVVVKILDLFKFLPETVPEPGETNGTYILFDQLFKDAVTFILKVAELDLGNKPVVINYSIGSSIVAHDGFTEQEEWLTQKFGAADGKGLFVTSAGNDRGKHTHAVATIQPNGEINIPFKLIDIRSKKTTFDTCKKEVDRVGLYIGMWYTQPAGS